MVHSFSQPTKKFFFKKINARKRSFFSLNTKLMASRNALNHFLNSFLFLKVVCTVFKYKEKLDIQIWDHLTLGRCKTLLFSHIFYFLSKLWKFWVVTLFYTMHVFKNKNKWSLSLVAFPGKQSWEKECLQGKLYRGYLDAFNTNKKKKW